MSQSPPPWLAALQPVRDPKLQPVRPGSTLHAWHVAIALQAWQVPTGRVLSGSDNWNGKALVVPLSKSIERSVGEVEVVERILAAYPDASAYWTAGSGNPPEIWRP